jgi:hypothetical protein
MKQLLFKASLAIKRNTYPLFMPAYLKIQSQFYAPYNSPDFKDALQNLRIVSGDSLLDHPSCRIPLHYRAALIFRIKLTA